MLGTWAHSFHNQLVSADSQPCLWVNPVPWQVHILVSRSQAGFQPLHPVAGGHRPLVELCVEPAGLSGRCTVMSMPLRSVPSPIGLPSKRGTHAEPLQALPPSLPAASQSLISRAQRRHSCRSPPHSSTAQPTPARLSDEQGPHSIHGPTKPSLQPARR